MRRKLLTAVLLLVAWGASAVETRACSCVEYGAPPCAAYWRADAVFTGVVTDIKKLPVVSPNSPPKALLRFIVEDKFRGISASEVEVATLSGTSCDIEFEKGERWLVYAYRDNAAGRLEIVPCTRTTLLKHADEDLSYIRGLRQRPPGQSILGRLAHFKYQPLADVKVTVQGSGQSLETVTDSDGNFAFSLPRAGAYTVRAVVPFSAQAWSHSVPVKSSPTDEQSAFEYAVEIPAGQCAYHEIDVYEVDLHATAEVSGKVTDEAGQPVTHGSVYLVEAVPKDGSEPGSERADIASDGSFKFEGVAVGSFILVINPRDEAPNAEYDAPHPRTFYPGVADREQASPLVITEGLKLEGVNFRVRGPLRKRVITGRVTWGNGKAAEAYVSLYNGDKYVGLVRAGADGRFTMDVYGDFDYRIEAKALGQKTGRSEKVKVPPGDKPAPLVLKLKPE